MIEDDKRSESPELGLLNARMANAFGSASKEIKARGKIKEEKPAITEAMKDKLEDRLIEKQILEKRLKKMVKALEPSDLWEEALAQWKKIAIPEDDSLIAISEYELNRLRKKCNKSQQINIEMQQLMQKWILL